MTGRRGQPRHAFGQPSMPGSRAWGALAALVDANHELGMGLVWTCRQRPMRRLRHGCAAVTRNAPAGDMHTRSSRPPRRTRNAAGDDRRDGIGGAALDRGSGLRGLVDRVQAVGGTLDVNSPPGEGTRLSVRLPATVLGSLDGPLAPPVSPSSRRRRELAAIANEAW